MLDDFTEQIRRFMEKRRMRAELKRLRTDNKLDQLLHDAGYIWVRGDQGDDFLHVYRKGDTGLGSELFSTYSKDEAIWWIVQRYREEIAGKIG